MDGLQGRPVVAANAPVSNQVLTWDGTRWLPRALPVVEEGLVRLNTLSWQHRSTTNLRLRLDGNPVFGLAVAFTGTVRVQPGSLDADAFQLFVEVDQQPGLASLLRVIPARIVAAEPTAVVSGLITELRSRPSPAHAALLEIDRETIKFLREVDRRLLIVLRGDFILDATGRAVDAEHLRSGLPAGDRPAGSGFGIQGGRFESWVEFRP